jgi:hypothetical protein
MNQGIRDRDPCSEAEAEVVGAWVKGHRVVKSHSIRGVDADDWHCGIGVCLLVISRYELMSIQLRNSGQGSCGR